MGSPRHVLLTNPRSQGFQYGVLRDFEDEIIQRTGAQCVQIPRWSVPEPIRKRLGHGTRYGRLREYWPRTEQFAARADVAWVILMSPEDTDLDRFAQWDRGVGYRILYVFDTFASHIPALRRVLRAAKWDLTITSFHGAVPLLERETGRRWHAVSQGIRPTRFAPVPTVDRTIAFAAYGRRVAAVNDALFRWCSSRDLYFDCSTAGSPLPNLEARYLYHQYAWHLRRSWFSVCWPVEVTIPERAGELSPVTCRWFEAAAAGAVMLGKPPRDPIFEAYFGADAVLPLEPGGSPDALRAAFETTWANREQHTKRSAKLRSERLAKWSWQARVDEVLALAGLSLPNPG